MEDRNVYQVLTDTISRHGSRSALGTRVGHRLEFLTYDDVWHQVRRLRRGLHSLGLGSGDRVSILSENRAEWAIADLAIQCLGAVTIAIYPTLPASQIRYLLSDSAAKIVLVSDAKQLAKIRDARREVPTLHHIVLMDGPEADDLQTWEQVLCLGDSSEVSDSSLDAAAAALSPDEVATLIYTSGTTGEPKGAMLTQRALLHTAWAAKQVVRLDETDVFLSFLPLCHVIERVGGHYLPLYLGASVVYSQGVFTIGQELCSIEPTVFLCVPRLYEGIHEKVMDAVAKAPPRRRRLAQWAISVGKGFAERVLRGQPAGPILRLQKLVADRLVLSKIRNKAVGSRNRFFVSGGAPLSSETSLFFEAIGVTLVQGFGLTEMPVISINLPERNRLGTVGPPMAGIEAKIADDGEILARGPSLMKGYFGKPEATRESIDEAGWFHTGDVGEMLPEGSLRITDRKKDIIVLANGKNVAPQPIEAQLKHSAYIAEAVLIGDRQATIVALIVPAFDRLKAWAKERGIPVEAMGDLISHAEVRRLFKDEIDNNSRELADFERIKRFTLIEHAFSIDSGELTPTLKVKRRFVAEKYAVVIEQMVR